ncbi:cation-translocating P-type ATPase [Nitrosococcus wardiae]|uniref:cation-translocating P-type ATPase n=1 Tax=Nitrosococcus wardiae TaxID=1814290 RepID=UPI00197D90F2|nr:HAD-IC family P-type ATPase [Nitrosococcus wardiae]
MSHQQRKNHHQSSPQSSRFIHPPLIQPVHTTVRGRARFKIPALHRAKHLKAPLEESLQARNEIHSVRINPLLGSLLAQFDPAIPLSEIVSLIQQQVATVARETPPPEKESPTTSKVTESSKGSATVTSIFEYWSKRNEHQSKAQSPTPPAVPTGKGTPWHSLASAQVLQHLQGDAHSGLTAIEANQRLARYGPNQLLQARARSPMQIFLSQFNSLPVWLLGASAGIAIFTGGLVDAAVILGVVLINATIGFVTEQYAERTLTALTHMESHTTLVLREGQSQSLPAEEVVPGDVILLTPGNYVPADIRLLAAKRLSLDESALTGESLPVTKNPEFLGKEDTPLGDRLNMSYMGTTVTGGSGRGIVVATGAATEIGKIQTMVGETKPPETPMERQLDQMGTQVAILSAAVCAGVYAVGLLRGYGWLEMLKSSISLAVAAVPEGLPPVATTTLALGMRSMNRRKVLIRQLGAVETLGSVQVIYLDKTGTLTQNRMTVVSISTGRGEIIVNDGHFYLSGEQIEPTQIKDLLRFFQVITLCNEAELEAGETPKANGSSTENALLEAASLAGIDIHQLRQEFPRLEIQHRAEGRNYLKALHEFPNGKRFLAIKGSPSQVLTMCHWRTENGEQVKIREEDRSAFLAQNETMAADSLRVLALPTLG